MAKSYRDAIQSSSLLAARRRAEPLLGLPTRGASWFYPRVSLSPGAPILRVLYGLSLACVAVYLVVSAFEPIRTNWGDPWSDTNAMTSGRHFDREGFVNLAFTPRVDIGPIGPDTLIYTHYPPLPDLVNGFLRRVSGGEHLALFRIVALCFSALSLWFFHAFLHRLWGSAIAKLSILLMATNLMWLQYADTLHHIPLYTSTGFAALAAAVAWLDERRPWQLVAVGVATFFCFLASYDFYFLTPIMLLAAVKFRNHRWFGGPGLRVILVFGFAGLLSIIVKNLLVIWAIGTHEWFHDLVFQFLERSTSTYSRSYKQGFSQVVFWRMWRFYTPLLYVCGLIYIVEIADRLRGREPEVSLQPLSLLAAGVPFIMVFSQLIVEQYHPTLLILPFAVVSISALIAMIWRRSRVLAALLLAFYMGWQGFQFKLFRKTFLAESDIAAIQRALESDRHNFVMTNMLVDAPARYYWNRYAIGLVADPMALRTHFEVFGEDSPLTLIQIKNLARYAYDKGIYMIFGGEHRWTWISRPDYYRNSWGRRFDASDRAADKALAPVGKVVHESSEMRVRQVTLSDIDRLQRALVPRRPVRAIDFESPSAELYKLRGLSPNQPAFEDHRGVQMPGFAWLQARQPTRLIFTLKGFDYIPTRPLIRTSELLVPIKPDPAGVRLKLALSTPVWGVQVITVRINGHELVKRALPYHRVDEFSIDVPGEVLASDGMQSLTLEYSVPSGDLHAARLHRLEVEPGACTSH